MICFYHDDLDGRAAAAVIRNAKNIPCMVFSRMKFIPMEYKKEFPIDEVMPGEIVFIVDFSIDPAMMKRLMTVTNAIVWIDHHKTAIEKYKDFPGIEKIDGIREDGKCGALLTFEYVYQSKTEVPYFLELINSWDIWKPIDNDETERSFKLGMDAIPHDPEAIIWEKLFVSPEMTEDIITQGEVIKDFVKEWSRQYTKLGFYTTLEGKRCFAMNLGFCNSTYFWSVADDAEILMPFVFDGDTYTVSLYSTTVDVSEIAKKFGGGGHKGASGFTCKELPFKKSLV